MIISPCTRRWKLPESNIKHNTVLHWKNILLIAALNEYIYYWLFITHIITRLNLFKTYSGFEYFHCQPWWCVWDLWAETLVATRPTALHLQTWPALENSFVPQGPPLYLCWSRQWPSARGGSVFRAWPANLYYYHLRLWLSPSFNRPPSLPIKNAHDEPYLYIFLTFIVMIMSKNINLVAFKTLWCLDTKGKNESQLELLLHMLFVMESKQ